MYCFDSLIYCYYLGCPECASCPLFQLLRLREVSKAIIRPSDRTGSWEYDKSEYDRSRESHTHKRSELDEENDYTTCRHTRISELQG